MVLYMGSANDPLAQMVEHLTFNQGVRSSSLRWVTSRQCLHPVLNEVQCGAKLHTTRARFRFKSGCLTKNSRKKFREFLRFTIHEKENLQKTIDKFPITEYNENTKELPLTVAPYGYVEITALLEAEAVISFYRNDL